MMKSSIKEKWKIDYNNHGLWISTGAVFFLAFISFYYIDLKSLTIWSTNIWDTIAYTGDIKNYYVYSALNLYGLEHKMVGSDILIYIPWAIWNLPIWAIQFFAGISIVSNPIMLLYSKCFLILVVALICNSIKNIYLLLGINDELELGLFFFLTSPFMLYELAYAGQNDLLIILLFLCSIYYLLKEKRMLFLFFAAVCIGCKPFFLFSYIAIVLLIEKKIWKDFLYICGLMSLYIIQKLIFYNAPLYSESISYGPTDGIVELMTYGLVSIPPITFSLFFGSLCITFFMAYFSEYDNENKNYILYYALLSLICYFCFVPDNFYRVVYVFSIWSIVLPLKKTYLRLNILLEIVYTLCFGMIATIADVYFMGPKYLLWANGRNDVLSISDRLNNMFNCDWSVFAIACSTICTIAIILIGIINHPRFNRENRVYQMELEGYIYIVRFFVYLLPVFMAVLCSLG